MSSMNYPRTAEFQEMISKEVKWAVKELRNHPSIVVWCGNNEGDCAKLPRDAFFGSGAGHQILLVAPSLNLIVVRFGALLAPVAAEPKSYHEAYRQFLFEPLMQAITATNR